MNVGNGEYLQSQTLKMMMSSSQYSICVVGTKQRLFRGDAKLNNVYVWVGSLSPKPMYFKFSCGGSALIPASASVSNFTLTTLNMTTT